MKRLIVALALLSAFVCVPMAQAAKIKPEDKKPSAATKAEPAPSVEAAVSSKPVPSTASTDSPKPKSRKSWVPWKRSRTDTASVVSETAPAGRSTRSRYGTTSPNPSTGSSARPTATIGATAPEPTATAPESPPTPPPGISLAIPETAPTTPAGAPLTPPSGFQPIESSPRRRSSGRPPAAPAPIRPTIGRTRVPIPAGDIPAQDQVMVEIELYRVRGDISGKTSLTDYVRDTVGEERHGSSSDKSAWTCSMHPQIMLPRAGNCPICGMELFTAGAPFRTFSMFTQADLKVAGIEFRADEKGWTWNGERKPPPGHKVEMLAAPKVMLVLGNSFTVGVDPQQPVQYFQRRPDGLFDLKTVNEQTGLSISAIVKKEGADRILLQDFTVSLQSIEKRLPLPGVNLDVGQPIINRREYKASMALQPNRHYGMQMATEGMGFLIMRLAVQPVQAGETPVGPGPSGPTPGSTAPAPAGYPRPPEVPGPSGFGFPPTIREP